MLHLTGISKQFGSRVLFAGAEAHLGYRSRVALIGPNGSGKSTLIRIILGQEAPDSGQVIRASHLAIGYLAQETPKIAGQSVLEAVMRVSDRREELLAARQELEERFARHPPGLPDSTGGPAGDPSEAGGESSGALSDDLERYGRVLEELDHLDEYRLEAKAKEILGGMGFRSSDLGRSLAEFSGGWLMRVALSRVLLMDPDLLLLDEPTNHLDLESLLWLEDFLRGYQGALLLVSHDTEFLNRAVSEVLEIDQRKLWAYSGNLDSYARQKRERIELLRARHASQQARIAEIESFVSRFGAKATKARQAQSRLKQLEKMDRIELPDDRPTVRFRFPPAPHGGKEVVTVRRASMRFGARTVFRDLDWVIRRGTRTAIVGVNGAGKTTLLRLLAGLLAPSEGEVRLGHQVRPGYYAQLQGESIDPMKTVLEELETTAPETPVAQVRSVAGAFLFTGDAVGKKCGVLSGGEKARVALAKLLLSPSNFLLLDEPTNHLDVESRGVLLDALSDYEGTLCLISHDRSFISPLVDNVLEIEPGPRGSTVTPLLGSYEDYLARLERKLREMAADGRRPALSGEVSEAGPASKAAPEAIPGGAETRPAVSNNQRRSWTRERDRLEEEIGALEAEQARITELLANPETYRDPGQSMELAGRRRTLEEGLKEKMSRWEALCGLLETT